MTVNLDPKYRPLKNGLRVEAQSPAVRKKQPTHLANQINVATTTFEMIKADSQPIKKCSFTASQGIPNPRKAVTDTH